MTSHSPAPPENGPRKKAKNAGLRAKRKRLYTRRGDLGETSLFSGPRVGKDHPRIETLGAVDELSAFLSLARAQKLPEKIDILLESIQVKLISVGTEIAAMTPSKHDVPVLRPADIRSLEDEIDVYDALLPSLTSILIPGTSPQAAALHAARAVCRRAERRAVALLRSDASVSRYLISWLNRLGDLLFVLARSV
ncbi:MAG: cob(I)yrinic acid a,c-diamide adenosyltransferase [Thermoguttaceae bacterium]|nr:cob(I)yrinic acid a,c-diamide adenosyltransferase [Thermoguttaceae bacterium]